MVFFWAFMPSARSLPRSLPPSVFLQFSVMISSSGTPGKINRGGEKTRREVDQRWSRSRCDSDEMLRGGPVNKTQTVCIYIHIYVLYVTAVVLFALVASKPRGARNDPVLRHRAAMPSLADVGSLCLFGLCWRVPSRNPLTKRSLKNFKVVLSSLGAARRGTTTSSPAPYEGCRDRTRTFGARREVKLNGTVVIAQSTAPRFHRASFSRSTGFAFLILVSSFFWLPHCNLAMLSSPRRSVLV